jgi:ankyrin repeat protein
LASILDPLVIHGADVNAASNSEETPLHIAAKFGSMALAEALVTFGAVVDTEDNSGNTPLHDAIAKSHFSVAKVLLKNGADPNRRNNTGQAPLDVAPLDMVNQTRTFFDNWEDWDELVDAIEYHGKEVNHS